MVLGDLWTRLVFAVKNGALLILTFPTFPSHILFNQFVWSYTKQKDTAPLPNGICLVAKRMESRMNWHSVKISRLAISGLAMNFKKALTLPHGVG